MAHNDRPLTVEETAERLGTGVRFARRLIAERRITFVKVGRNVAELTLDDQWVVTIVHVEGRGHKVESSSHPGAR